MRVMSIALVGLASLAIAGCGGSTTRPPATMPVETASVAASPAATASPTVAPSQLRVAYVNLGSPIVVDANDLVAAETFEQRLQMVIDELKRFDPDIVGVSEATWTPETSQAWAALARGLGMEAQFGRANPWYPGQDRRESDQTRDLVGFEEGDAILSRFPIKEGNRIVLNPRTSESEGRSALRVTVLVPGLGEVAVYVARLSGDEATRRAQATNLSLNVELTSGQEPRLVMADLGLPPDSNAVQLFTDTRYFDSAGAAGDGVATGTCCRQQILIAPQGGTATPGLTPSATGTVAPAATPTPPAQLVRTMYVLSDRWRAVEHHLLFSEPKTLADGSLLYASDSNGVAAVLSISDDAQVAPTPPGN